MAETRIHDEGFVRHTQELLESGASLQALTASFTSTIAQVAAAWEGEGAKRWQEFASRAAESHEDMKRALATLTQKVEGVSKASLAGQAEQTERVATRHAVAHQPLFR